MTNLPDTTIAIIGTGIGGTELAGYLGLHGYRVRVHDIRPEAVRGIADHGGLDVEGIADGFAPIEQATTDLTEAVAGAGLIIVTTLNNDHRAVSTALAPLLQDGQLIGLIPGYVGGSPAFRRLLLQSDCRARVVIGEMDNFPFTGELTGPARVRLASLKRQMQIAVLPSQDGHRLVEAIQSIFPQVVAAPSVLHTWFSTINPIVHVPGMLANVGWIESEQGFQFYGQGITASVARQIDALDAERVTVATAYGVTVPTLKEWLFYSYGLTGESLYDIYQRLHNEIFKNSPAPDRLDHRYVVEDVPYGLVPLAELGRVAGVPTPVAEALTTMASVALSRDFWDEGRTLAAMGLDGLSVEEIRSRLM